ncbi:MAG: acetoacetate--CoA ligase, partial [Candidatus Rokubacteria bacterium]|nr:acetoacetate--CoA ligase [Candidatus Rokubacteria bacterium]
MPQAAVRGDAAPLWRPSPERVAAAQVTAFTKTVAAEWRVDLPDHDALWRWSVERPEQFWRSVWTFCGVIGDGPGGRVLEHGDRMPGARWFPEARLNFAENLLRRRDDTPALVFWGESQVRRRMTWRELWEATARLAAALRAAGVGPGDRVAGYLPNMPEAIVGMLATASLGAIWSSCSPDFGVQGVLDRFGQIEPKILISADGYRYTGKANDSLQRLRELMPRLPSVRRLVVVSYLEDSPALAGLDRAVTLEDFTRGAPAGEITFPRLPFDHPLYILYSSGTTGVPKCIVHGAGGTLLQHLKEHRLHTDLKPGDRLFYFTTCGWMMWNWLASGLASEATLLLYDGSPFYPIARALFDFLDAERATVFGTSAKFIDAAAKAGLEPARTHRLDALRTICSTGSPLAPEAFDYVYEKVKRDVCLSSISGGTDIVSCFVLGNPIGPVWRGEIQARGLGMKVEVFDEDGRPVVGAKGELVCTAPFPSMPVGFWNDPDGTRYRAAYFERFPGVWRHGDWVELTEHGGMIIYGRSDAVLNPGGVRIGTAEIYRQVEQLDEVVEALAIGQDWQNDVRVVLFVKLRDGVKLDDGLKDRLRKQIRQNASPRHVPSVILQVEDIPRTKSGKI